MSKATKKVTKESAFSCFRIKSHYEAELAQGCATQAIHGLGGARRASCAPPFGSLIACGEFGAAGGAKSNGKTEMGFGFCRNDDLRFVTANRSDAATSLRSDSSFRRSRRFIASGRNGRASSLRLIP
ncbi:hypothetical protein QUV00_22510, partial [Xanthomonas citri pv. citri]